MAASDDDKPARSGSPRMDRRALLTGAAVGAVGAASVAVGVNKVHEYQRKLVTPAALPPGSAPEIGVSFADSHPVYEPAKSAPKGAPNIIAIILDDVGFSDLGCYGSEIATPNMDALAAGGLRYNNFRTTAMCSPTRAAFLTGLNHHSAGMGWLADLDSGYPGYRGDLTHDAATIAEVLRDSGWNTLHVGKWHVNNVETTGPAGPYDNWPTSRGYERAYWFQGHSTDNFRPGELYDGLAPVEAPRRDGYFAPDDLTDRAISYINTQKVVAPDKPFFLSLAYPTAHSPIQAPPEERDAYKGKYDAGWDVVRAARLERQQAMGLVPKDTKLPPLSFGAKPWDELSPLEKHLYPRYMEVYAGAISRADKNIGRLLQALETLGIRDNTLVVLFSDNGGSGEGTPTGTPNIFAPAFGREVPLEEAAKLYDKMGEIETFPHYPMGWANVSNTPFRLYKQYVHLGGIADPFIVNWPAKITDKGAIRQQFAHVIDLFPTLLDAAGVQRPEFYLGRRQKALEGASLIATFTAAGAATRDEQYFELGGTRAYVKGKWRLVADHSRGQAYETDHWELYDSSTEVNELTDISAQHPDIVDELKKAWFAAAAKYNVLPLDDRNLIIKMAQYRQARGIRPVWEFHPPVERIPHDIAPMVNGFDHVIEITLTRPEGADGVLVASGSRYGGWVIYIKDGRLYYEVSLTPWSERIETSQPLPTGKLVLRYQQTMTSRPFDGGGALYLGDQKLGERSFAHCNFSTSYDGFTIGADLGNQVSTAYDGPFPFAGSIEKVLVKIDTRPMTIMEQARFLQGIKIRI